MVSVTTEEYMQAMEDQDGGFSAATSHHDAPAANEIRRMCTTIQDMLLDKNRRYGNSALAPVRICSKADAREQLLVRIDDKLNRLINLGLEEDTLKDLAGYVILLLIRLDDERSQRAQAQA